MISYATVGVRIKQRFTEKNGGEKIPVAKWEETCSKCIYGTTETRLKSSKGRCTHKNPDQHFDIELGVWICESFKRRWDTRRDLELSRRESQD